MANINITHFQGALVPGKYVLNTDQMRLVKDNFMPSSQTYEVRGVSEAGDIRRWGGTALGTGVGALGLGLLTGGVGLIAGAAAGALTSGKRKQWVVVTNAGTGVFEVKPKDQAALVLLQARC